MSTDSCWIHGQIILFIILLKVLQLATDEVFASTGSSIIVYNKEFAELKKMSRINGLTETGISTIAWSEENKTLIIAYTSTNVDLLKNNIIYNIPDIDRKYIPGKKEINRIRTNGKYAYLACSFGIVVVDLNKKEIYDTWKPGTGSETLKCGILLLEMVKFMLPQIWEFFLLILQIRDYPILGTGTACNILPNPTGKYTCTYFFRK